MSSLNNFNSHSFKRKQNFIIEEQGSNEKFKKMKETLDNFIQICLDNFTYTDTQEDSFLSESNYNKFVINTHPLLPDLVIYNKTFNKNECFYDYKGREFNPFPRVQFKIKKEFTRKMNDKYKLIKEERTEERKNSYEESNHFKETTTLDSFKENKNEKVVLEIDSLFGMDFKKDEYIFNNTSGNNEDNYVLNDNSKYQKESKVIDEEVFKRTYDNLKIDNNVFNNICEDEDTDSNSISNSGGFEYSLFSDLSLFKSYNSCKSKEKDNIVSPSSNEKTKENVTNLNNIYYDNSTLIKKNLYLKNWIVSEKGKLIGKFNSIELFSFLESNKDHSMLCIVESSTDTYFKADIMYDNLKEVIYNLSFNTCPNVQNFSPTLNENLTQNTKPIYPSQNQGKELNFPKQNNEQYMNMYTNYPKGIYEENPFFNVNYFNYPSMINKNCFPQNLFYNIGIMNSIPINMNINVNLVRKDVNSMFYGSINSEKEYNNC